VNIEGGTDADVKNRINKARVIFFNFFVYGVLVCSLPKILISDFVESSDVHDLS
jgi:hypothetical protein